MPRKKLETVADYLATYPRITAHIICESLGYATPSAAARILKDAREGHENWCEWVFSCYEGDPRRPISMAIRDRHHHRGYMADYKAAQALVKRAIESGEEPLFASWF